MRTIIAAIVFSFLSPLAFAHSDHHGKPGHGGGGPMKEPTKEERTQMATMHTNMAACLATEKPMADCHKEMMDGCPMAKEGKCPMMAMMNHPHGGPKGKGMKMDKGRGKDKKAEKTE